MAQTSWLLILVCLTASCVSVRPIEPARLLESGAAELAPDEGILVAHIHSELAIEELRIDGAMALVDLAEGEHFRLLALPAGRYRWSHIVIPVEGRRLTLHTQGDVWEFRIEAGRLNYPGQLHLQGGGRGRYAQILALYRNRSAWMLRELRERFGELPERYPPTYTGAFQDDFLDYYAETYLRVGDADPEAP